MFDTGLNVDGRDDDEVTQQPQVSRRIPIMKLPVKARSSDVHAVRGVTGRCTVSESISAVSDSSKQSVSGSVTVNVSTTAGSVTTKEDNTSQDRLIVKKPRLETHASDSLLTSPTDAGHMQNIAALGAENLGNKTPTKLTYVGSGILPLSPPTSSPVTETTPLSYSLYTPFMRSGQSSSTARLIDVSSPQRTVSWLPKLIQNINPGRRRISV